MRTGVESRCRTPIRTVQSVKTGAAVLATGERESTPIKSDGTVEAAGGSFPQGDGRVCLKLKTWFHTDTHRVRSF